VFSLFRIPDSVVDDKYSYTKFYLFNMRLQYFFGSLLRASTMQKSIFEYLNGSHVHIIHL